MKSQNAVRVFSVSWNPVRCPFGMLRKWGLPCFGTIFLLWIELGRAEAGMPLLAEIDVGKPIHSSLPLILEMSEFDRVTLSPGAMISACTSLLKAEQLLPKDIAATLYFRRGIASRTKGQLLKAGEDFISASKLRPEWLQPKYYLAGCLFNQGKVREASDLFNSLLPFASSIPDVYIGLASVYLSQEKYQEAERMAALGIDTCKSIQQRSAAYRARSLSHFYQEHWKACLQDIENALVLDPGLSLSGQSLLIKGRALLALGRLDESIIFFHAVEQLAPNSCLMDLWQAFSLKGLHNVCAVYADKMLAINEKDPNHLNAAATTYNRLGQVDLGLKYAKKLLQIESKSIAGLREAGIAYAGKNEYATAAKFLDDAANQPDNDSETLSMAAMFFASCPECVDTKKALRFAIELRDLKEEKSIDTRVLLGLVFAQVERFDLAMDEIDRARKLMDASDHRQVMLDSISSCCRKRERPGIKFTELVKNQARNAN